MNERAEAARQAARDLGDLLHEKQLAYGSIGTLQAKLWPVLLESYRTTANGHVVYVLPEALVSQIPRLTRVLDRIGRIIGNPEGDRMGESPWRDLAGDAVIGLITEVPAGTHEVQGEVDLSGMKRPFGYDEGTEAEAPAWSTRPAPRTCPGNRDCPPQGLLTCSLHEGHEGRECVTQAGVHFKPAFLDDGNRPRAR